MESCVGLTGPKRRIQGRLAGLADLTTIIEGIFSACDTVLRQLVRHGAHIRSYADAKATGKPVEGRDFAVRRFEGGQVVES